MALAVSALTVSSVPGVSLADELSRSSKATADLRRYHDRSEYKAFAVSITLNAWGWGFGYGTRRGAERRAIRECEVRGVKCLIYAVGDSIVWDSARARKERETIVSSQSRTGAIWRYYDDDPGHGVPVSVPDNAPSIISDYHARRGVLGNIRGRCARCRPRHGGIDIIGETGTPVLAAGDGTVITSAFRPIGGKSVRIRHRDPASGRSIVTSYIHLDEIWVDAGERVTRGQEIGTIGVTGSGTTPQRAHLHFEVEGANPHEFWHDGPGRIACYDESRDFAGGGFALTYPVYCQVGERPREIGAGGR